MIPKSKRLSRKDIGLIKQPDIYSSNTLLSLKSVKIRGVKSKISFSVSKKVSKSAVVRNRLRRYGYRAVVPFLEKIENRFTIVYYKTIPKNFSEVESNLKEILNKSKIIK